MTASPVPLRLGVGLVATVLLVGCGAARRPAPAPPVSAPLVPAAAGGTAPPAALPPSRLPPGPTVPVRVGRAAPVAAEVADTTAEREVGLMGRGGVPPGTGMVFRYAEPTTGRYYMYRVPFPLTAVFARAGRVVGVLQMAPCARADPQACPTYGPGAPFDTVLETAPLTVAGLVAVGEQLVVGAPQG